MQNQFVAMPKYVLLENIDDATFKSIFVHMHYDIVKIAE